MQDEKEIFLKNTGGAKYNGTAPGLFMIPLGIYEDELQRNPAKKWSSKISSLEKASNELKEKIGEYTHRINLMKEQTKELVARSLEFNKKFFERSNSKQRPVMRFFNDTTYRNINKH